jgi:hypothetical protein
MVGSGNWQSCDGGVAFFVPGENRAPRSVEAPTQVDNLMRRMSISRESQGKCNSYLLLLKHICLLKSTFRRPCKRSKQPRCSSAIGFPSAQYRTALPRRLAEYDL